MEKAGPEVQRGRGRPPHREFCDELLIQRLADLVTARGIKESMSLLLRPNRDREEALI
jgi:hypothetical protein